MIQSGFVWKIKGPDFIANRIALDLIDTQLLHSFWLVNHSACMHLPPPPPPPPPRPSPKCLVKDQEEVCSGMVTPLPLSKKTIETYVNSI